MVGFSAEAKSEDLTVDHEELETARWFSRQEVESPQGFFLPPPYSLASKLLARWLAR
jgi:NAD+ diphosphatase